MLVSIFVEFVHFGAYHCVGVSKHPVSGETDGHPEMSKTIKGKSRTRPDVRYVQIYLNVYNTYV